MSDVPSHYTQAGGILERILTGLGDAGLDRERFDHRSVAGADEFHLGGPAATAEVVAAAGITAGHSVLDVGCGIGGPARHMASAAECVVHGVDVTPEFVDVAAELSRRAGLGEVTTFELGDATELRAADESYDVVTVLHVGMNVADKALMFDEMARVVRPGGAVAVYDIMQIGDGEIDYPVPWSTTATTSHLESPDGYRAQFERCRLTVETTVEQTELVRAAVSRAMESPPPVNLSHLMGDGFTEMFGNLFAAMSAGTVAPVLMVGRR